MGTTMALYPPGITDVWLWLAVFMVIDLPLLLEICARASSMYLVVFPARIRRRSCCKPHLDDNWTRLGQQYNVSPLASYHWHPTDKYIYPHFVGLQLVAPFVPIRRSRPYRAWSSSVAASQCFRRWPRQALQRRPGKMGERCGSHTR